MAEVVLDASAVIALLFSEPGHDKVEARIAGAAIATVNLTEVADFLARKGMASGDAERAIRTLKLDVAVADENAAFGASELYLPTRSAGLSLADRFCLELAKRTDRVALSADRAWSQVGESLGIRIELIR